MEALTILRAIYRFLNVINSKQSWTRTEITKAMREHHLLEGQKISACLEILDQENKIVKTENSTYNVIAEQSQVSNRYNQPPVPPITES